MADPEASNMRDEMLDGLAKLRNQLQEQRAQQHAALATSAAQERDRQMLQLSAAEAAITDLRRDVMTQMGLLRDLRRDVTAQQGLLIQRSDAFDAMLERLSRDVLSVQERQGAQQQQLDPLVQSAAKWDTGFSQVSADTTRTEAALRGDIEVLKESLEDSRGSFTKFKAETEAALMGNIAALKESLEDSRSGIARTEVSLRSEVDALKASLESSRKETPVVSSALATKTQEDYLHLKSDLRSLNDRLERIEELQNRSASSAALKLEELSARLGAELAEDRATTKPFLGMVGDMSARIQSVWTALEADKQQREADLKAFKDRFDEALRQRETHRSQDRFCMAEELKVQGELEHRQAVKSAASTPLRGFMGWWSGQTGTSPTSASEPGLNAPAKLSNAIGSFSAKLQDISDAVEAERRLREAEIYALREKVEEAAHRGERRREVAAALLSGPASEEAVGDNGSVASVKVVSLENSVEGLVCRTEDLRFALEKERSTRVAEAIELKELIGSVAQIARAAEGSAANRQVPQEIQSKLEETGRSICSEMSASVTSVKLEFRDRLAHVETELQRISTHVFKGTGGAASADATGVSERLTFVEAEIKKSWEAVGQIGEVLRLTQTLTGGSDKVMEHVHRESNSRKEFESRCGERLTLLEQRVQTLVYAGPKAPMGGGNSINIPTGPTAKASAPIVRLNSQGRAVSPIPAASRANPVNAAASVTRRDGTAQFGLGQAAQDEDFQPARSGTATDAAGTGAAGLVGERGGGVDRSYGSVANSDRQVSITADGVLHGGLSAEQGSQLRRNAYPQEDGASHSSVTPQMPGPGPSVARQPSPPAGAGSTILLGGRQGLIGNARSSASAVRTSATQSLPMRQQAMAAGTAAAKPHIRPLRSSTAAGASQSLTQGRHLSSPRDGLATGSHPRSSGAASMSAVRR
eukprot:TRINITY_DN23128_c0_g1_i2.p1 TRINITY_DN23128_c0_g1~~TRINITY_DN23128_c0_g1_i2.p1  ORF type:complete len:929 (+),score=238.56 TRINITY_DN23128_c0_g1_i2:156-2942(+)